MNAFAYWPINLWTDWLCLLSFLFSNETSFWCTGGAGVMSEFSSALNTGCLQADKGLHRVIFNGSNSNKKKPWKFTKCSFFSLLGAFSVCLRWYIYAILALFGTWLTVVFHYKITISCRNVLAYYAWAACDWRYMCRKANTYDIHDLIYTPCFL